MSTHLFTEQVFMRTTTLFSFIILMLTSSNSYAKKNKFVGWGFIQQQIKLNKKFSLHFNNSYKTGDDWKNTETYITLAGIALGLKKIIQQLQDIYFCE